MSSWKYDKLSNICSKIGDGLHGTPKYVINSDIYFINGNNLKNGWIEISKNTKCVSDKELASNYIPLDKNTLLLSINGTLGNMAFYRNEKVILGKSSAYLNFKTGINKFYYYYFQLPSVQQYFFNVATGSTIKNLSLKSIQDFFVPVPEYHEWNSIASILSSLDAKIELNNRINTELEEMAKALYDYWFVQFDFPDDRGLPYHSSGGRMVWNEELKREVPEGWEVKELATCISTIIDYRGKTPKKLDDDWSDNVNDIIALSARHVKNGKLINLSSANRVSDDLYNKWMREELREGDILLTSEAPCGEFFYVFGRNKYCLSQRLFAIRSDNVSVHHTYLYFELSRGNGLSQILGKVSGSTVFGIRQDELRTVKILVPKHSAQSEFANIVQPIFRKIRNNDYQIEELSSLRDWLLPMLMNGQVRVG